MIPFLFFDILGISNFNMESGQNYTEIGLYKLPFKQCRTLVIHTRFINLDFFIFTDISEAW